MTSQSTNPPDQVLDTLTNSDNTAPEQRANEQTKEDVLTENPAENEGKDGTSKRPLSLCIACKICFDSNKEEETITPCLCKGSIAKVHLSCLERWLGTTNAHACELCGYRFSTIRRPKYSVIYSVYFWLFKENDTLYRRGVGMDIAIFLLLTPIIATGMYCCVTIASFYQHTDQKSAAGNWTSISLTLMSFVMALGYYLWASIVLKSHGRIWYRWWQARNVVRVLNAQGPVSEPVVQERRHVIVETAFI